MVTPTRAQIADVAYEAGFTTTRAGTTAQDETTINNITMAFELLDPYYAGMTIFGKESERRNVANAMNRAINAESGDLRDFIIKDIKDHYLGMELF